MKVHTSFCGGWLKIETVPIFRRVAWGRFQGEVYIPSLFLSWLSLVHNNVNSIGSSSGGEEMFHLLGG